MFPDLAIHRRILQENTNIPDNTIETILYFLGAKTPLCKLIKPYVILYNASSWCYTIPYFVYNLTFSMREIGTCHHVLRNVLLSRCYTCKKPLHRCHHIDENELLLRYNINSPHIQDNSWW